MENEKLQVLQGLVVKIATTADECIRITIDTDSKAVPEGINVLQWKNQVVAVALITKVKADPAHESEQGEEGRPVSWPYPRE